MDVRPYNIILSVSHKYFTISMDSVLIGQNRYDHPYERY